MKSVSFHQDIKKNLEPENNKEKEKASAEEAAVSCSLIVHLEQPSMEAPRTRRARRTANKRNQLLLKVETKDQ